MQKDWQNLQREGVPLIFWGEGQTLLQGWLFAARPPIHRRLVLVLHDFARDQRDAYEIIRDLRNHGLCVFVYDQRGHGISQGKIGKQPQWLANDLRMAYQYIHRLYPNRWDRQTAVIGEGIGADAALLAAAREHYFQPVVAVNPMLDFKAALEQDLRAYPQWLIDLTTKRISLVAQINYNNSSPLQQSQRLSQTRLYMLSPRTSEPNIHKQFCSKVGGLCQHAYLPVAQSLFWWHNLSSAQRDKLVVFVMQYLQIHARHYQKLIPPPPSLTSQPSALSTRPIPTTHIYLRPSKSAVGTPHRIPSPSSRAVGVRSGNKH
jgi:pimeloyl-ACP methyl ester carboxylesterase